ncbi:hypothetical protein AB4Y89_09965 [Terriglobus sp. 2YAB30_2]|uniref:hypothetical protein n=1 Tax=Terriglobus sp. 2YAB30_2 TaxID=3233023 RepID=UPI003F97A1E3
MIKYALTKALHTHLFSFINGFESWPVQHWIQWHRHLIGSPSNSVYKGILFFQDRTAAATTHSLGGGGAMKLVGTIYLTNTRAIMLANAAQVQQLNLQGGSGSGTQFQREIIVGALQLGGNGSITMNINSSTIYHVSEVALVQ